MISTRVRQFRRFVPKKRRVQFDSIPPTGLATPVWASDDCLRFPPAGCVVNDVVASLVLILAT